MEDKKNEENVISTSNNNQEQKETEKEKEQISTLTRQNIMCNHCRFVCETYDKMKEHYQSDFHKYNLNRVTMNLAPIMYEEYISKKNYYLKQAEEKKKKKEEQENDKVSNGFLLCDICQKKFLSRKKLKEHLNSKMHQKNENLQKDTNESKDKDHIIKVEEIKTENKNEPKETTLDNITICLFCNQKSKDLENNFYHMINIHHFDIPFLFCIKNYKGLIKLLAKKIFTYHACIKCDTQKFSTIKALQSHMLDKAHTSVNNEDLDEYLYKYYDMKKLVNMEPEFKRMKEYKILYMRYKVNLQLKKDSKKEKDEDKDWEEVEEEEEQKEDDKNNIDTSKKKEENDEIEDKGDYFDPIQLPSGELLLEDGTTLGNKIYNIYYKQRVKISRYEDVQKELNENFGVAKNNKYFRRLRRRGINTNVKNYVLNGSNKAIFDKKTTFKPRTAMNPRPKCKKI